MMKDMEITIGVQNVAREIVLDVELTAEEITESVNAALAGSQTLTFTDSKGQTAIVPAAALGYVITGPKQAGRVGFSI